MSGMGFGLAGTRPIIEQQGSTIGIESEDGKGTIVTMPLAPPIPEGKPT
jgi:signal transduction histidine kinase